MLYLEDYLESIEHLPQKLENKLAKIGEKDLIVQNKMTELEKRQEDFFNACKEYPDELPASLQAEYEAIRKEYNTPLEDSDEKVDLSNQLFELVDKHARRLDAELHKVKCELEADNKGITEVLEKRSLELDIPINSPKISSEQEENEFDDSSSSRYRQRNEKRHVSNYVHNPFAERRQTVPPKHLVETKHNLIRRSTPPAQFNVSYDLGHTSQQVQQGRRTASHKPSYQAINTGNRGHEYRNDRELAGAVHTVIQDIQVHTNIKKKQKKCAVSESPSIDVSFQSAEVTDGAWTYASDPSDQSEVKYCICNEISEEDMVGCDNENCPTEWFHYSCVGITTPPEGNWFCPQCLASMKRRGSRKK